MKEGSFWVGAVSRAVSRNGNAGIVELKFICLSDRGRKSKLNITNNTHDIRVNGIDLTQKG